MKPQASGLDDPSGLSDSYSLSESFEIPDDGGFQVAEFFLPAPPARGPLWLPSREVLITTSLHHERPAVRERDDDNGHAGQQNQSPVDLAPAS